MARDADAGYLVQPCTLDLRRFSGDAPIMDDLSAYEECIAHLMRTVDELSDEVARQSREIAVLTARVARLMEGEASRAEAESGGVFVGDERPPHY